MYREDSDDDGLDDGDEQEIGTYPLDEDSDDDGLDDGDEQENGTDPLDEDSDDDGVSDGDEVRLFGTNPLAAESVAVVIDSGRGGGSSDLLLLALLALTLFGRARRFDRRS